MESKSPSLILHITAELKTKLDIISSNYNIEVGYYFIGEVRNGEIFLQDILIPNQQITTVSVEINPKDQIDLLKRYGDKVKKIIGHGHSHWNLGCFWSSTDINNMNQIMTYKDFFVFIVSSKGNHLIKVIQKKPYALTIDDAQLNIKTVSIDLMKKFVDNLVKQNTGKHIQTDYFVGDKKADEENYQNYKNQSDEEEDDINDDEDEAGDDEEDDD
jgi:proteasome lid subunit RPN8/RPN11